MQGLLWYPEMGTAGGDYAINGDLLERPYAVVSVTDSGTDSRTFGTGTTGWYDDRYDITVETFCREEPGVTDALDTDAWEQATLPKRIAAEFEANGVEMYQYDTTPRTTLSHTEFADGSITIGALGQGDDAEPLRSASAVRFSINVTRKRGATYITT
jgi:hypothetical protein